MMSHLENQKQPSSTKAFGHCWLDSRWSTVRNVSVSKSLANEPFANISLIGVQQLFHCN